MLLTFYHKTIILWYYSSKEKILFSSILVLLPYQLCNAKQSHEYRHLRKKTTEGIHMPTLRKNISDLRTVVLQQHWNNFRRNFFFCEDKGPRIRSTALSFKCYTCYFKGSYSSKTFCCCGTTLPKKGLNAGLGVDDRLLMSFINWFLDILL